MYSDTRFPPVPLWRLFFRMGGWISLMLFLPALILIFVSLSELTLAERFEIEGRETVARITDKYLTESTDSDGDRTVTYYLVMEFTTRRSEEIGVARTVSRAEFNRAQVGQTRPIWYLDSEPTETELVPGENRTDSRVAHVIAWLFGAGALAGLWYWGSRAVAAVRARKYGARLQAVVVDHAASNIKVNNEPRYRLVWRLPDGSTGESLIHRHAYLRETAPRGSEITVYQGLKRSWWAGDVGDRG